ncbi:MAG: hypothetical protein KME54_27570 [Tolypothrix brevis GSE-NOS-MK-07-07A]|jgi:hypothetical protein|nr:hypothetical protein [Tolypothrix brevis GSE-NOS-MK-07-07A]
MPVDYAEATKLQDFKVEAYKSSDTSNSQPTAPSPPAPPSQLSVPDRDTGLGKPNNLPQRQGSLRNDGQYRTTDVTPESTAKSPPPKQNNQLTRFSAREDAVNQAVYYSGFFVTGVIDAINDDFVGERYEELVGTTLGTDLAFHTGKRITKEAIDLINDGVKNGEKLLDDLWRNKPTFEIPQIKIPKFDLPGLPNLEIPKFPDFKFPEISFPKPEPIKEKEPKPIPRPKPPANPSPKRWTHEFHIGEYDCYVFVAVGFYGRSNPFFLDLRPNAGIFSWKFKGTPAPPGMEEDLQFNHNPRRQQGYFPNQDATDTAIFYHSGNIGRTGMQGITWFTVFFLSPDQLKANKGWLFANLPEYSINSQIGGGRIMPPWTVLSVRFLNCGNAEPPPIDPPPPPPEDDCCRMGCCPKPTEIDYKLIKQLIDKSLKEQKFTIEVPICKCELNKETNKWTPKTDNVQMEVFATSQKQAEQLAQLHLDNARQAADLCLARNVEEPIAAIPQSWQIRHEGGKPQLVIQCAEKKEDGKYGSAMYPITVPHWKGGINDKPSLPAYKKGNWEGILVLADNTKVTINAASESECTKILNAIKPWIKSEMLKDSYFKGGKINADIKPTQVKPMYGRYFKTGQKNNKPDWRVDFP